MSFSRRYKNYVVSAALVALAGCSGQEETQNTSVKKVSDEKPISFLVIGDAGYHYTYQDQEAYDEAFPTVEALEAAEREEWINEDFKPADEFVMSPLYFHQGIGGYIDASGIYAVGKAMINYCQEKPCEFGLMTGDNIYPDGATLGTDGRDDPTRFQDIFVDPYVGLATDQDDFKFYVALGNHDWYTSREGAMAQVEFHENNPTTYMDGIFYRVVPPQTNGEVEIFVIDTKVMLAGETVLDDQLNPDGSEKVHNELDDVEPWIKPVDEAEATQAKWLEEALQSSTAKWKLVVGHHPLWSSGGSKFEEAKVMRQLILPTLCKYADAYFAGHEHSLEIHTDTCAATPEGEAEKPFVQILSGAGAKQRSVHSRFVAHQAKNNPQMQAEYVRGMVWGFAHMELMGDTARATMIATPNEGSGEAIIDHVFEFQHRSQ